MVNVNPIAACAVAVLLLGTSGSRAHDEAKYPAFEGAWMRDPGPPRYDPSKPPRRGQAPPLTPEYQAIFEASLADQANGGQGNDLTHRCIPVGMPRQTASGFPIEIVVTAKTTYILFESSFATTRRIHTDGRAWPDAAEPTFAGYSIGEWLDTDGDGRYDTLEIETRYMKGPRAVDNSGIPLHEDNGTIVKERMFLNKTNPDILNNQVTTFDKAFTHPWTVMKNYRRSKTELAEDNCDENNHHVQIGAENYYLSADGYLMPAKKGQRPPDLRYFRQSQK
jgi:hypothetical protein